MVLGQFAPVNPRRLSELMHINPGTISVYVQRLVENGPVQRGQDAEDRRNRWLSLTEAGQMAYQGIVAGAIEYMRDFLSALDDEESLSSNTSEVCRW